MTTKNLHIMGLDTGGTTGWTRLTVPRACIFGDADSDIVEWDYGVFSGPEPEQALAICQLARETQGLDYKCGPALLAEAWVIEPQPRSTDLETLSPLRINTHLVMLHHLSQRAMLKTEGVSVNWLGDATLHFQDRTLAKTTATDERLKRWRIYVTNDHIRDATRHAITGLRRARNDQDFARQLWPY